jgi:ElaB/YqjD/DUF883 family membrane-anchored ribosome-binding protein
MNDQDLKGAANNVAGKIQGAAGALTGDSAQELKGKFREVVGQVQSHAGDALNSAQESAGEALDTAREFASSRPVGTIVGAAVVGFLLGVLVSRRD